MCWIAFWSKWEALRDSQADNSSMILSHLLHKLRRLPTCLARSKQDTQLQYVNSYGAMMVNTASSNSHKGKNGPREAMWMTDLKEMADQALSTTLAWQGLGGGSAFQLKLCYQPADRTNLYIQTSVRSHPCIFLQSASYAKCKRLPAQLSGLNRCDECLRSSKILAM